MVISSILANLADQFKSLVHNMQCHEGTLYWKYAKQWSNFFLLLIFFSPSALTLVAACTQHCIFPVRALLFNITGSSPANQFWEKKQQSTYWQYKDKHVIVCSFKVSTVADLTFINKSLDNPQRPTYPLKFVTSSTWSNYDLVSSRQPFELNLSSIPTASVDDKYDHNSHIIDLTQLYGTGERCTEIMAWMKLPNFQARNRKQHHTKCVSQFLELLV